MAVSGSSETNSIRSGTFQMAILRSLTRWSRIWDLPGWAREARGLRAELDGAGSLADGFMVIARVLRHLRGDPCLPPELLPGHWPGKELRDRYAEFSVAYAERLRDYSQG